MCLDISDRFLTTVSGFVTLAANPAHRGAFLETILKRSEMRFPQAGLVTPHSGGFGHRTGRH